MNHAEPNPFCVRDIRLLVFDLDGTLLDSIDDIADSVNAIRNAHGLQALRRETVMAGIGKGARYLVAQTIPEPIASGTIEMDALYSQFHSFYKERSLERPRLYPFALEFLAAVRPYFTLAVLTNKPQEITLPLLQRLGLLAWFARVVTPEEKHGRKPDPGGLLALMEELGRAPGQTLLVGDSINDFAAGQGAGVFNVGMRHGYYQPGRPDPDLWVEDFAQLHALWEFARRAQNHGALAPPS